MAALCPDHDALGQSKGSAVTLERSVQSELISAAARTRARLNEATQLFLASDVRLIPPFQPGFGAEDISLGHQSRVLRGTAFLQVPGSRKTHVWTGAAVGALAGVIYAIKTNSSSTPNEPGNNGVPRGVVFPVQLVALVMGRAAWWLAA